MGRKKLKTVRNKSFKDVVPVTSVDNTLHGHRDVGDLNRNDNEKPDCTGAGEFQCVLKINDNKEDSNAHTSASDSDLHQNAMSHEEIQPHLCGHSDQTSQKFKEVLEGTMSNKKPKANKHSECASSEEVSEQTKEDCDPCFGSNGVPSDVGNDKIHVGDKIEMNKFTNSNEQSVSFLRSGPKSDGSLNAAPVETVSEGSENVTKLHNTDPLDKPSIKSTIDQNLGISRDDSLLQCTQSMDVTTLDKSGTDAARGTLNCDNMTTTEKLTNNDSRSLQVGDENSSVDTGENLTKRDHKKLSECKNATDSTFDYICNEDTSYGSVVLSQNCIERQSIDCTANGQVNASDGCLERHQESVTGTDLRLSAGVTDATGAMTTGDCLDIFKDSASTKVVFVSEIKRNEQTVCDSDDNNKCMDTTYVPLAVRTDWVTGCFESLDSDKVFQKPLAPLAEFMNAECATDADIDPATKSPGSLNSNEFFRKLPPTVSDHISGQCGTNGGIPQQLEDQSTLNCIISGNGEVEPTPDCKFRTPVPIAFDHLGSEQQIVALATRAAPTDLMVDDDFTYSQMCASDEFVEGVSNRMKGKELQARTNREEGSQIVRGLVAEVAKLNRLLMKRKRKAS